MNQPSDSASPRTALEAHLALVEEVHRVIQEENQILKQTCQAPDEAFLRRKALLLPRLDASLNALRVRSNAPGRPADASGKELLRTAQQKLHKLLLLDRENEQLLMRCTLTNGDLSRGPVQVGSDRLGRTYGQQTRR